MSKRKSSFLLRSNERKMVASIATHFEKEHYSTFVERTLATGVSRRTLFNIRKELRETGTLTSTTRPSSREAYKPIDSFDETAILNKAWWLHEADGSSVCGDRCGPMEKRMRKCGEDHRFHADNAADVLQRNLVVDLGAHTDSETDTASEAEWLVFKWFACSIIIHLLYFYILFMLYVHCSDYK